MTMNIHFQKINSGTLRVLLLCIAALLCISVIAMPVMAATAAFTASPTSGTAPLVVQFTDASTGSPSERVTNGGFETGNLNGWSASNDSPYTYVSVGSYAHSGTYGADLHPDMNDQVSLSRTVDFTGASTLTFWYKSDDTVAVTSVYIGSAKVWTSQSEKTTWQQVSVNVSGYTGSQTLKFVSDNSNNGDQGSDWYLDDISMPGSGTITGWSWNFGDSGTSTLQNPSHTYTVAGTYTVALTATDAAGSNTSTQTDYIAVSPGVSAPVAGFAADVVSGSSPLTVTFTDQSTNDPTSWSWTFGDGGTSTVQNPVHQFTAAGMYSVTLTASNAGGSNSTTKTNYITVSAPVSAPVANFTGTPRSGTVPLTVAFTDASTNTPTSWAWTFGDGGTSTEQNPGHTYSTVGTYTVTLTATNAGGSNSVTKSGYITVSAVTNGGLASTAWPKFQSDTRNTGQSLFTGPQGGIVAWASTTPGSFQYGGPSLGADGTIYIGSYDNNLSAYNPDGTLKWKYLTGGYIYSTPAIGSDGTIYVGSNDKKLYAINPDGTLKWSYTTGNYIYGSPAIGSDGTIYVGDYDKKLYAVNPDGTLKWSYTTGGILYYGSPAIGSDGTIYIGSYDRKLYAVNPDGTLKWSYTAGTGGYIYNGPAIGSDGTIYVGGNDKKLYAINPSGTLKWSYTTGGYIRSTPAIGSDGTIYAGSYDKKLYAINPDGTLKWSYTAGGTLYYGSPVIGSDGTIYVGSGDNKVSAINHDGTLKWSYTTGSFNNYNAPAIGSDGTLYVGGYDKVLYAFRDIAPVAAFSADVTSGAAPLTVTFTDASTGPTSWSWDFGDGTNATVKNPVHTYASEGTYTVKLTVTNMMGSDDETKTGYIAVSPASIPVAAFNATPTSGTVPLTVAFTDASENKPASWNWSFGDGSTSSAQNPSHTYTISGTYTVTLTVTNSAGSDDETKTSYITVIPQVPVAAFSGTPRFGPLPLTVQFNDTTTNIPTSWAWDFGDGSTSSAQNPSHLYTTAGTYSVMLTATNAGGSNATTKTSYITVMPAPAAAFSGTPTSGSAPLTVAFTDQSATAANGWAWYFGDEGFTSPWSEQTAAAGWSGRELPGSVVLPDGNIILMGGYDSTYKYNNDVWKSTDKGATWTQINANAGWTGRTNPNCVVLSDGSIVLMGGFGSGGTDFHDVWKSTDGGVTWTQVTAGAGWSARAESNAVVLPDGSIVLMGGFVNGDSSHKTDVWRSVDGGATWTQMTASAGWGSRQYPAVVALPDNSIVLMGGSSLNDTWRSTDAGATWTQVNASSGWSGRWGSQSVVLPDNSIVLIGGYGKNDTWRSTDAGTTWTQINASPGWSARYASTSTALPDGSIVLMGGTGYLTDVWRLETAGSNAQNPSHTYTRQGTYQVSLQSQYANGYDSTRKTNYITVGTPVAPVAAFTGTPTSGTAPLTVQFTDASTNSPTSWAWDFGDSNTTNATVQNPVHTYAAAGTYTVKLTATNSAGSNTATQTNYITASAQVSAPVAAFSGIPTSGTAPLTVTFTDASTNAPTSWAWTFGDGSTSTAQSPSHQYTAAGTYTVNLTATNSGGSNTVSQTGYITVSPAASAPVAAFSTSVTNGLAPVTAGFTDASTNTPSSWNWEYKLNSSSTWTSFSTSQNPSHDFTDAGTYDIRLTATNAGGSSTATKTHVFAAATEHDYLATITSGTVNGDLYTNSVSPWGDMGGSTSTLSSAIPSYTDIQWARVYVNDYSGSGTNNYPVLLTTELDANGDGTFETTLGTETCDIQSGTNGYAYPLNDHVTKVYSDYEAWYDVTSLITSANPKIRVTASNVPGTTLYDGRIKGITLVVAYNNGSTSQVKYWVNHGNDWFTDSSSTGFDTSALASGWTSAEIRDIAFSSTDASYTLNSGSLTKTVLGTGSYYKYDSFDVTGNLQANAANTLGYTNNGASFKPCLATLAVKYPGVTAPVAAFSGTPTSGTAPLTVQFTDASTNAPTLWSWNFGDGDSTNATVQNPVHTYAAAGTYNVTLTATNSAGSNTATQTSYITVGTGVITLPGNANPPKDLNSDGLYEDVNGNNRKDVGDVVLFIDNIVWVGTSEPISAFDFNHNGRIDVGDVIVLLDSMSG
jgi:PKD repeat protein